MEDYLDHPLFDTWQIIESRGIGKGKRYEITPKGLTIGRSAKADIIVLSSTVNEHHAVVEWDSLREEYLVRDLSTRNGTFVNQQPIRGIAKRIERGDSLRFGYDTDQVFRVEVLKGKPSEPPTVQNTSIQTNEEDTVPHTTSSHVPSASPVHVFPVINQTQTVLLPMSSPTPSPTHQGGILMAVNTVPMATVIATVSQIVTTHSASLSNSSSTPLIATTTATQTKMSASESNKDLLRVRIDGRKSVDSRIKGSPLYGVPSWWGEEESEEETLKVPRQRPLLDDNEMPFSDSELIPKRPGSQILRDIDDSSIRHTHRPHLHVGVVSRSHEHLDEVKSVSNDENTPTSFTVEFEGPKKKLRKPPGLISKRPASYAGELSQVEKASIPTDPRGDNVAMVTTPRRRANRKPGTFTGKTVTKKSSSKPPSGLCKTSSPKRVVKKNKKEETFIVSESNTSIQEDVVISPGEPLLQSQSEIIRPWKTGYRPMKSHSQPSSLQGTPYASSESGSRPGSARKQWIVENEIPHTLIMASVETRMKRLSANARKTVENVKHTIEVAKNEGLTVEGKSVTDSGSSPTANSDMTLWKIVNKEYESISKYIMEVEKSLQAINDTVGGCDDTAEQVDYEERIATDYLLVDSIEEERDLEESSSSSSDGSEGEESEGEEEEVVRIERNLNYDGDDDSSDQYYSASEPED